MSKSGNFFLMFFIALFATIFNWIAINGADTILLVERTEDTKVELTAVISGATERTTHDEGTERTYWDQTVSYTYNGKSYSDVRYDSTQRKPQLGKEVRVAIDPENPGELLPDAGDYTLSLIFSPIFLTGVTLAVYALTATFVEENLKNWNAAKVAYGLTICKLVGESVLYYKNNDSWLFGGFSLVAAVASLIISKKFSKKSEDPAPQAEISEA